MNGALSGATATLCGLIEVRLPTRTLRWIDGSADVTWNNQVFTGEDPEFGAIDSISELSDGLGENAPSATLTVLPPTNTAAATLANPTHQGSEVSILAAVVDPVTGTVTGTPYALFEGELDVPRLRMGEGERSLEIEIVSVFERFFEVSEGARLSNAHHQSVWPGELGFDQVTGVGTPRYWGADGPKPAVVVGATLVGRGGGGGQIS
jgi:hypothetical protein